MVTRAFAAGNCLRRVRVARRGRKCRTAVLPIRVRRNLASQIQLLTYAGVEGKVIEWTELRQAVLVLWDAVADLKGRVHLRR